MQIMGHKIRKMHLKLQKVHFFLRMSKKSSTFAVAKGVKQEIH